MAAATLAAIVAVSFAVAAVSKLTDLAAFRRSLPATLGIPPLRARALAPAVVAAELVVALTVTVGLWWRPAAIVGFAMAAGLYGAFTVAIRSMIARGVTEPCHCFGADDSPPGRVDVIRNGCLIAVSLGGLAVAFLLPPAVDAGLLRTSGGIVIGTVAALLVVYLDDLAWLFGPALPGVE